MDLQKLFDEVAARDIDRMSKAEYAAMRREEWKSVCEKLERQSEAVMSSGGALKAFLDFTACDLTQSMENQLLLYAQNPNILSAKTSSDWLKEGRRVPEGTAAYAGIDSSYYEHTKKYSAQNYSMIRLYDIRQTEGWQAEQAPAYSAEELVKALFIGYLEDIRVTENAPDMAPAQYISIEQKVYVQRGMESETAFWELARELAAVPLDKCEGRFWRDTDMSMQCCAAYLLCRKYGQSVGEVDFHALCDLHAGLPSMEKRKFLTSIRHAAYHVDLGLQYGLDELRTPSLETILPSVPEQAEPRRHKNRADRER